MNLRTFIFLGLALFLFLSQCKFRSKTKEEAEEKTEEDIEERKEEETGASFLNYRSDDYDFSLKYPPEWTMENFRPGNDLAIINFFPENKKSSLDLPVIIHSSNDISFAAIFPEGYGTELPMGKTRKLNEKEKEMISFTIDSSKSEVFLLENDQAWAFFLVPSSPPDSWGDYGFVFVQIAADSFRAVCIDEETGEEKSMEECDPMRGDRIRKYGRVSDENSRKLEFLIQSLKFTARTGGNQGSESYEIAEDLMLNYPAPGEKISTPLAIKGKARGPWYFEGSFSIQLAKNGKILAEARANAQEDWMTNDFVTFTAELEFDDSHEKTASLIFKGSNPSGKPENQKMAQIKVKLK